MTNPSRQDELEPAKDAYPLSMTRRRLLRAGASSAGLAVAGHGIMRAAIAMPSDPFARLDATAQAELARKGAVTARELVEAAIKRIESIDPKLNAVVTPIFGLARDAADRYAMTGPFGGVPFAIKDLVDLKGVRTTAGSRLLAANVATDTTPIVSRLLAAGFIALGKTNTPEFGLNASTEPLLFGPTRNPWNIARSPGGSSGGSAAAVASGMVPVAHASDGGGSIRIPASCCGLFGLKPSRSRMVGSQPTDSGEEGCLSRSVRDSATLLAWAQRKDAAAPLAPVQLVIAPAARRLKIALATLNIYGREPKPEVKRAIERTAQLCAQLGHHVEPAILPVAGEEFIRHFMVAWSAGAARVEQLAISFGKKPEDVLEPWTLYLAAHARAQVPDAAEKASAYFGELTRRFAAFFANWDVALSPVVDDVPPPLGYLRPDVDPPRLWARLVEYVSYTPIYNVAGVPAISVPLQMSTNGLPIGSQFAARIGGEQTLLELAFELEAAQPWSARWPAVAAA